MPITEPKEHPERLQGAANGHLHVRQPHTRHVCHQSRPHEALEWMRGGHRLSLENPRDERGVRFVGVVGEEAG